MSINWNQPNEPFEVELSGKKIKLKPHKRNERKKLYEDSKEYDDEQFFDFVRSEIVSIDGVDDLEEFMSWQNPKTVSRIYTCIIVGDALTEEEVKNFVSLSVISRLAKPARGVNTVEKEPVSG